MKFDTDVNKVWLYKLSCETYKIANDVDKYLHTNVMQPKIDIVDMETKWGVWEPANRTIKISHKLVRNFEWAAVTHVLRHEFAHLIVDEVLKVPITGVSHGEAFKKACDTLGIDSNRCASYEYLSSYKTSDINPLCEKVQKLMIKGNCSSLSKEEANLFLNKAQQLMIRHNIDMKDICGNDRFFIVRPVGPRYKKMPRYLSRLRDIVEKFYFVKTISSYSNDCTSYGHYSHVEMFGEKHNVEIAEYIYHALLNNAELAWKEFKQEIIKNKTKGFHKNSFIFGLFRGYYDQLESQQKKIENVSPEEMALIHVNDPLLNEMYRKEYPRITYSHSYYGTSSSGYSEGHEKGKSLRLSRGVGVGSNGGRVLSA